MIIETRTMHTSKEDFIYVRMAGVKPAAMAAKSDSQQKRRVQNADPKLEENKGL